MNLNFFLSMMLKTPTVEEIRKVILNHWVYDRITDDKCPATIDPPLEGFEYIGAYVDGEIAGLGIYHDVSGRQKFHFQMLPRFRHLAGFAFRRMLRRGIFVEIPDIYPDVIRFALHFGFHMKQRKLNAHLKNGVLSDTLILEY